MSICHEFPEPPEGKRSMYVFRLTHPFGKSVGDLFPVVEDGSLVVGYIIGISSDGTHGVASAHPTRTLSVNTESWQYKAKMN
jgi:hypothetical protein